MGAVLDLQKVLCASDEMLRVFSVLDEVLILSEL